MSEANPAGATVHDLIRLREQLTGWIARLDEVGSQASSRVAERIRADYADRLRRVNEDLSSHRGEIDADLAQFRAALGEAEGQRAQSADALDEMSLRHLIGELDESAWDESRPGLERQVQNAEDAVARARAEVERLEQLAADIAGAEAAAAAPPPLPSFDDEPAPTDEASETAPWTDEAPSFDDPERAQQTDTEVEPEPQPSIFSQEEEFEPQLPDEPSFQAAEPEPETPAAEAEAAPADPRQAAEAASGDEWDPFGSEFAAEPKPGDAEEDLPWLEGIDEAARGWQPPAADEGLDFLREIEETTRGGAEAQPSTPSSGDLGADDLAFLEELDRAIGSSSAGAGARTPAPPPPPAEAQPTAAPGGRAEPLLCKECGAINEPHSWYCEICGSEL
jgi:hypothetical protein